MNRVCRWVLLLFVVALILAGTVAASPEVSDSPSSLLGPDDDLHEAIQKASPGATIHLGKGDWHLSHRIFLGKPLSLVGMGMGKTRIVSTAHGSYLTISGAGGHNIEGISFSNPLKEWPTVGIEIDSLASIRQCEISDAVVERGSGGIGIKISGSSVVTVSECVCRDNQSIGISVQGNAEAVLIGNTIEGNNGEGISYGDESSGKVDNNQCTKNLGCGISAQGKVSLDLSGNICKLNDGSAAILGQPRFFTSGTVLMHLASRDPFSQMDFKGLRSYKALS
ncbi:MAG: right-handed parallel beta-helix repeat-containing protein [Candidatus Ozemobacteraceae bacterium]